ncbi:MAG: IS4 family transposase [Isosphaeraceae bacterium]
MPTQSRIETAVEVSPLTVLVRGVLEWACPQSFFEELFDRECRPTQWNRKLTISAIAWLMLAVVSGVRRSVFAAFQADQASDSPTITATATALYAKYGRIDPRYTTAVVRESGRRMSQLLRAAGVEEPFGWEGYRVVVLDGTDLGGTEHRLKVLRGIKAAGLPGRFVAAYEWATAVVVDAAASEDAYTSERELVRAILAEAKPDNLFVADRHFCTTEILFSIVDHRAFFVIRQHENLRWRPLKGARSVGRVDTGEVWEEPIEVEDTDTGECRRMRRIVLELDTPTDEGDTEIVLLSNLERISALRVCELYRERWTIERHFSLVKTVLRGEVESLGRPRAALFAMGMALVAANALAVVKQALRATHGEEEFERLSGYYMADEVAGNYRAVDVLVAEAEWRALEAAPAVAFWEWCRGVASRVRTRGLHKHPRGPKKPQPPRASGKNRHHYSTYRLLDGEDP